ncbi:M28 family peptidase [Pendulispora brunnea]|uniref:Vacuolar membrane protease n=1 Tax=Pendulispora brunnea TaxID=2905690 RepID=A0ABZ2KL07_9BACT
MNLARAAAAAMFAAAVWLGAGALSTPEPAGPTAPLESFSAARAFAHVEAIAREPHPMGSPAHEDVRSYLLEQLGALGLEVQTQESVAVASRSDGRSPVEMGRVRNVVARRRGNGKHGSRAILLAAHYDSERASFGAADDGYGVAALLETARAVAAGAALDRDVLFLFSDGEERSLLGAAAFMREHPWRHDVDAAFNFDARGNRGPVTMFQSSAASMDLVERYLRAAPHPVANSISEELYKLLDNDTDFTEVLAGGLPGLNFANFRGVDSYHDRGDRADAADQGTLQHHGETALAMVRAFAPVQDAAWRTRSAVYFNLGPLSLCMPSVWMLVLAVACAAGLARRNAITDLVAGAGWALGGAVLAPALLLGAFEWLLGRVLPDFSMRLAAHPVAEALYTTAGASLALGLALFTLQRMQRRWPRLAQGAAALWSVLAVVTAIALPKASYLVTIPLCGFVVASWLRERTGAWLLLHAALAIPGVMLASLHARLVVAALGSDVPAAALVGFGATFVLPWLGPWSERTSRVLLLGSGAALGGALLLLLGRVPHAGEGWRSYTVSIDAGSENARWVSIGAFDPSCGPEAPSWKRERLPELFPGRDIEIHSRDARAASVTRPTLDVLEDVRTAHRALRMHIGGTASGAAGIYIGRDFRVTRASLEGRPVPLTAKGDLAVRFWAPPPEGLDLELELETPSRATLRVVTDTPGVPAHDDFAAEAACFVGARTMVTTTFEL